MAGAGQEGRVRLLGRNVVLTYAVWAATLLSGLIVTPIIVRALGLEAYGLWAFIGSLTAYLLLLDLGVGASIIRFGAEARGRGSADAANAIASVGLAVYTLITALALVLGVALAWLVPVLIELPDDLVWPARVATLLLVAGDIVRFPLGLFSNLLAAQQRYDVLNVAALASLIAYSVLVAAILSQTGDIVLLAGLAAGTALIRLVLPLYWVRRELPGLRLRRSLITRTQVRELVATSSDNLLIHIAAKVVFTADVIVVGIALGAEAAAFYAIPAKLFALAFAVGTAGTNLLYPAYAELEGADDAARQRQLLKAGLRAGTASILLFALPLLFLPEQLMEAWIGEEVDESVPVLVLLALALVVYQPIHLVTQYLIARGRQRPVARIRLAVVAANVLLSIVLAATVGVWGVALSTLATELVALALIPRLAARAAGIPLAALARAAVRPLLPALALGIPILLVGGRLYAADDLVTLAPLGALWLAAFVLAAWRFGLSGEERAAVGRRLRPRPARADLAASETSF